MESEKTKGAAESAAETSAERGTAVESATSSSSPPVSMSLHDCLSLGEIEAGLTWRQTIGCDQNGNEDDKKNDDSRKQEEYLRSEEVQRLPYLLRLLSSTRPLASIHPFVASKKEESDDRPPDAKDTSERDEYLDRIVDRLEDVAANYSVAGGIDVLTNHLAPAVAKNLSRLPSLKRSGDEWKTQDLAAVARDPIAKRKRRRSSLAKKRVKTEGGDTQNEDALGATSDEGDDDKDMMDIVMDETIDDRRNSFHRRDSMIVAAEDSQESTVIKTLSELASLVVASLDNKSHHEVEADDEQHAGASSGKKSWLTLETDDILSEKAATEGHTTEGNDLSSTIVSIMQNAPVLQSRHVARALCRASVPQTGALISRLGANCPASIPSLLLGCIEAYSMSIEHHHKTDTDGISNTSTTTNPFKTNLNCPVVTASKSAISALAKLSSKESVRVQTKLQSLGIMMDVQLRLLLEDGSKEAKKESRIIPIACLLVEQLSFPANSAAPFQPKTKSKVEQAPGDANTDSTQDDLIFDFSASYSNGGEPSLLLHFLLNEDLFTKTLDFFSEILKQGSSIKKSIGKWCMILRALLVLLLVPRSNKARSNSYKACIESFLTMIKNLDDANGNDDAKDLPKQSMMDTLVSLVPSCAVLLLSRSFETKDTASTNESQVTVETLQAMKCIFKILRSTSEQANKLRISLENEMRKGDTWGFFTRVLYPLERASTVQKDYATHSYQSHAIGFNKICEVMRSTFEDEQNDAKLDITFDIFFRLSLLRREFDSPSDHLVEETKRLLRNILEEENEYKSLLLMNKVDSAQFVVEATNFLVKPGTTEIPLVLPANIDMAWSTISSNWKITDPKPTNGRGYNFLLQMMYALTFLDKSSTSPFAFDPRSAPIKESLVMIESISSESTRNYLLTEFQDLIQRRYPEFFRFRFEEYVGLRETARFDSMDRKSILAALCGSIQQHMRENKPQLGESSTEQVFLQAKARVCDSDLYAAITNAFLSSANAPSPTYTYYRMCRDPLVCLKFPLCVWERRSLRRIALSVLENLLASNTVITLDESKLKETAMELLAARDTIVVRCLLSVLHGGESKNMNICSMTTSFIRWMIRCHPGLFAIIVKQGLQVRDLDWLIENVPETMNDSRYLLQIFSERNGLTAAERLVAADAAIRVAIVHGQANEAEAGQIILTTVSQLVDSFYLLLGPVGLLPVDALFTAESTTPITQISQKAAFRILKALTKRRNIKNHHRVDISIKLQNLIGLCKQELQGSATGRRKQLVKEIYDAAVRVEK